MAEEQIQYIFVYGSLRPHDDSSTLWTKTATEGMLIFKAIIYDHCMYFDRYAAVKTNKPGKQVVGYVMTIDPSKNALWKDKIKLFDDIEGISRGHYQRTIATANVIDTGESVQCYIYVNNSADESFEVPDGDWLRRDRNTTDLPIVQ
jgi:gamma-glutamylcyclotransferase (GGCT)/AIG2-like uncharacterized protein YtfP